MTVDLKTLFEIIEQLPPDEQERVRQFVETRKQYQSDIVLAEERNPELRLIAVDKAIDSFREGLTEAEFDGLLEAMNSDNVSTEEPDLFAWIDQLPEDER